MDRRSPIASGAKRESVCGRRETSASHMMQSAQATAAVPDMQPQNTSHMRQISPSIPLSRLIEFAVQRTYHELEVLTDL